MKHYMQTLGTEKAALADSLEKAEQREATLREAASNLLSVCREWSSIGKTLDEIGKQAAIECELMEKLKEALSYQPARQFVPMADIEPILKFIEDSFGDPKYNEIIQFEGNDRVVFPPEHFEQLAESVQSFRAKHPAN